MAAKKSNEERASVEPVSTGEEPVKPLSEEEQRALKRCEEELAGGLWAFHRVGKALVQIVVKKLHRMTHNSFDDYCRRKWKMSRQRAYQLMRAAQVMDNLSTVVDTLPANEAQARALTRIKNAGDQRQVWLKVIEAAGDNPITAELVEAKVQEVRPKKKTSPTNRRPPGWQSKWNELGQIPVTLPSSRRTANSCRCWWTQIS